MAARSRRPSLVAIVGPTASGKSDLAMKVAKKFNGEIISADSRMIYKGMDIGTAKPTTAEQNQIKHWGIDLVEPGQKFNAARFKKTAKNWIKTIQESKHLPMLVGGSGLYVNAILYDYAFKPNQTTDPLNPRHRLKKSYPINTNLISDVCIIGLLPPDNVLKKRIEKRAEQIFKRGVVAETKLLEERYGRTALLPTAGIIYPICFDVIVGKIKQPEAVARFATADWQYARRQKTWFRRSSDIVWFKDGKGAFDYICERLNN